MLIVVFNYEGAVNHEDASQGQAINWHFYLHMLKYPTQAKCYKWLQRRNLVSGKFTTTMDQPASALLVCQFLAKQSIPEVRDNLPTCQI
jgi:hypothetical protein